MWTEGLLMRFVGMLLAGNNLDLYILAAVSPFVLHWGAHPGNIPGTSSLAE